MSAETMIPLDFDCVNVLTVRQWCVGGTPLGRDTGSGMR